MIQSITQTSCTLYGELGYDEITLKGTSAEIAADILNDTLYYDINNNPILKLSYNNFDFRRCKLVARGYKIAIINWSKEQNAETQW